jgi:MtaA/CmuA family methyltransferase
MQQQELKQTKMDSKQRCLNQLIGLPVDRIPVFPLLMGFAAKRIGATYSQYASDGEVMADAQINIYRQFNVDAISACSDAFRISADLGGQIIFPLQQPPYIHEPLVKIESDFKRLRRPDVSDSSTRMYDRATGVEKMVRNVGEECFVLGWVDMPFAEACSVCGVSGFMMMLFENPPLAHKLLDFLTGIVVDFALFQLEKGAPMIGAGDAAASLISTEMYREFALPYEKRVCEAIHQKNALLKLHICGNTTHIVDDMIEAGADLYNVDHLVDFEFARNKYSQAGKAFKGNLDPVAGILQSTPSQCAAWASSLIIKAGNSKYFLSAGCEVPAEVSDEVFKAFCNSVL